MASYEITYACGHKGTIKLTGKHQEDRLPWYERNALCPDCWREEQRKKEKQMGLIVNVSAIPNVGKPLLQVWFSGDTYSHKEEIKALGGWRYDALKRQTDYMTMRVQKAWNKVISPDMLEETLEEACGIGARLNLEINPLDFALAQYMQTQSRDDNNDDEDDE